MSETPIVHRSRCGCVHDSEGQCLMVCSVHTEAVEGKVGIRLRTTTGELAYFALAPEEERPPSPAESGCGEEDLRALGYSEGEIRQAHRVLEDVAHVDATGFQPGFDAWVRWGRGMGKNSKRQVLKALALIGMSLSGIAIGMLQEAEKAMKEHGKPPLTEREKFLITGFGRAQQHAIAEVSRVLEGA